MKRFLYVVIGAVNGFLLPVSAGAQLDEDRNLSGRTVAVAGPAASAPASDPSAAPVPSAAPPSVDDSDADEPASRPQQAQEIAASETGWSWGAFASAYYQYSTTMPNPVDVGDGSLSPTGRTGYAFADHHGFGLTFAGADASYMTEQAGLTLSLRWGPGAAGLIGYAQGPDGALLPTLAQGFVTWTPSEKLTIDAGQFATIYGAEVAEEWQNVNYTRGAVYYNLQPFYHLGVRAAYQVNDVVGLTLLAANGGPGERLELNDVPGVGAQLGLGWSDTFGLSIGYYTSAPGGIDENGEVNNKDWDQFVDLVATMTAGDLTVVFNGDFNYFMAADETNMGASLAVGYDLTEALALGVRGEYLYGLLAETNDESLVTGTLTARYRPTDTLVFSLEPRIDYSTEQRYPDREGQFDDVSFAVTAALTGHFDG